MIDHRKELIFSTDVNVAIIIYLESGFSQSTPNPQPAGHLSLKVSTDLC